MSTLPLVNNIQGVVRDLGQLLTAEEAREIGALLAQVRSFNTMEGDRRNANLAGLSYYRSELKRLSVDLEDVYNRKYTIYYGEEYNRQSMTNSRPSSDVVKMQLFTHPERGTELENMKKRLSLIQKYNQFIDDVFWLLTNTNKAIGANNG